MDRTGMQLLRDFMRDFVCKHQNEMEYDSWFRYQVQISIDSANAGNVLSAEEIERPSAMWIEASRRNYLVITNEIAMDRAR